MQPLSKSILVMHPPVIDPSIFRAYDIRGIFGQTLNVEDAYAIARAFAGDLLNRGGKTVCVAYDVRLSSPALEEAVVQGLLASGVDVTRVGMGPSPMLYYAQKHLETDAGLMITGSHNPGEYNGIKICLKSGPYFGDDIQQLGRLAGSGNFVDGQGQLTETSIIESYVERLMEDFDTHYARGRPLKIVWDPANGAACPVVQKLITRLPGDHIVINGVADGSFPSHHPDPCIAENMEQLSQEVRSNGFDLGIGFDGDGDRIGVLDGDGRMFMGDQLLAFYGEELAKTHQGAVILGDVKSSKVLFERLEKLGLKGQLTRTGHSYIKSCMRDLNCPLAGEMSGHMFFADRYYGYDDGLYAAIRLVGALSLRSDTLSQWMDAYPQTHATPENWHACADEKKFACIEAIKQDLSSQGIPYVDLDGIRVSTPDGWWLLRASNTQAVLVSRAESDTAEGLERLRNHISEHLNNQGIEV
jgi:phosphomannomutase